MSAKPGLLATAGHLAAFSAICALSVGLHARQSRRRRLERRQRTDSLSDGVFVDRRGRLVVVTGCDRGFGRCLVEGLLRDDADAAAAAAAAAAGGGAEEEGRTLVLALCLTEEAAGELNASASASAGGGGGGGGDGDGDGDCEAPRLVAVKCDVTSDADVRAMRQTAEELLAERDAVLHALVNNAAIASPGDFAWFPDLGVHERVMDVNYFGQLRVAQALLPLMLRTSRTLPDRRGARILNLSSVCGASASPGNSSYNASKFAVEAWSDSLRLELRPFHIAVAKVRPGQFGTEIQRDWARRMQDNFAGASPSVRELYGGDAYRARVREAFEPGGPGSSGSSGENFPGPEGVRDALMDLIAMPQSKIEATYWLGTDARTLWRALHSLPTAVSDTVKSAFLHFKPVGNELLGGEPPLPPVGAVTHLTIRVKSLAASLPFYRAMGFEALGEAEDGQALLQDRSGPSPKFKTRVLLREDPTMKRRGKSSNLGMTRLCLYTRDVDAQVRRLADLGHRPMGPTAYSKIQAGAKIAAYLDPDGFVVYYIQFGGPIGLIMRTVCWWNDKADPCLFHLTVNTHRAEPVKAILEKLGFKTMSDQNRDQILNDLLPAFNMEPEGTVIEHIRLCSRPGSTLVATVMEWAEPESVRGGDEDLNSVTLSVSDVGGALSLARSLGMETLPAEYRRLPVYGEVLVGTAFLEPGCNRIEFCCFSNKK